MCTALSVTGNTHCFGRNLDLDLSYGEHLIVVPRNFTFHLCHENVLSQHYATIGMGIVKDNFPLYFDGVNEHGLCGAGLNFPKFAHYNEISDTKLNLASFEVIPYILSTCKSTDEAVKVLKNINVTADAFDSQTSPSPLHWIFSDRTSSCIAEPTADGLNVYSSPNGVLTNSPEYPVHLRNLREFKATALSPTQNSSIFEECRLHGSFRIPSGLSSEDRFVRCSVISENSPASSTSEESIAHFFAVLSSVAVPAGCITAQSGEYHFTRYTSCCTDDGSYYYRRHNKLHTFSENLFSFDLESGNLIVPQSLNISQIMNNSHKNC